MWTISRACVRSTFLRGAAAEPLADYYAVGEPSAPSSSTITAGRSSSPARTTEALSRSRYGTTYVRLTEDHGTDTWTSLLVGSLVPTSPRSGAVPGSGEPTRDSGMRWPESSEKSVLRGFSPRTRPSSFGSGSTSSYRTLTRSGMMRSGVVSPRPSSAPPTSGTGYGFLGSPGHPGSNEERKALFAKIDAQKHLNCVVLPSKRFEFWPTPTYSDAKNSGSLSQLRRTYIPLSCRAKMNLTASGRNTVFDNVHTGRPNPVFLAWLMGCPSTWSSLGAMETCSFLLWLHVHSSILRRDSPECGILSGNKGGEPCRQAR